MHAWHDIPVKLTKFGEVFPVVIEVPKGSKNKYELDKLTGFLRLDRVLYSAVHYPADYGFIPQTFCDDDDPLDVLVLSQTSVQPLTIVEARAIGVMRMRDDKGIDDKIIAISVKDPAFSDYMDQQQLPPHTLREIRHFFSDYKALENKEVLIENFLGPHAAYTILAEALQLYQHCFPKIASTSSDFGYPTHPLQSKGSFKMHEELYPPNLSIGATAQYR